MLFLYLQPPTRDPNESGKVEILVARSNTSNDFRQITKVGPVELGEMGGASEWFVHSRLKKLTNQANRLQWIPMVGRNVLAANVGEELLITVAFRVQDEHPFRTVLPPAKLPAPEKESKFERHIEAREVGVAAEFRSGDIVDAQRGLPDQVADF